jgi:probable rRNA maturation factor
LSFPFYEKKELLFKIKKNKEIYLGDIIINLNKIKNKKNILNFRSEFNRLWVHGLVHLFGYDHKREKDYQKMKMVEKSFLSYID